MPSLTRRMQRKTARLNGNYEGTPQPVVKLRDGGYRTLHPTKGWLKVSGKRVKIYSSNKEQSDG